MSNQTTNNRSNGDSWTPAKERYFTKTGGLFILAGIVAFMLGVGIQKGSSDSYDLDSVVRSCVMDEPKGEICRKAIWHHYQHSHSLDDLDWRAMASETLKALSVALIASLVVSTFLEMRNRRRLIDALSAKAQEISDNVFDALFGNSHSSSTLEAVKSILVAPIVRERLDVQYTLSNHSTRYNGLQGIKFVKVEAVLTASLRNVAKSQTEVPAAFDYPVALSLPNPWVRHLNDLVKLKSLKLNGADAEEGIISAANAKFKERLDAGAVEAAVELTKLPIRPGETGRVVATYDMIMRQEDADVLTTFTLTQSLKVTVNDHTNNNLIVEARAIHGGALEATSVTDTMFSWELNETILPNQGIMILWRNRLESGDEKTHGPARIRARNPAARNDTQN